MSQLRVNLLIDLTKMTARQTEEKNQRLMRELAELKLIASRVEGSSTSYFDQEQSRPLYEESAQPPGQTDTYRLMAMSHSAAHQLGQSQLVVEQPASANSTPSYMQPQVPQPPHALRQTKINVPSPGSRSGQSQVVLEQTALGDSTPSCNVSLSPNA